MSALGANRTRRDGGNDVNDPGCVKTLHGITAPGILSPMVRPRAKKAKICLPLGVTTKSDFVFAQPRPIPVTDGQDCSGAQVASHYVVGYDRRPRGGLGERASHSKP